MNVEVDVWSKIDAALRATALSDATTLRAAASWALQSGQRLDIALDWIERAIKIRSNVMDLFVKAQLLDKAGRRAEAIPLLQQALARAEATPAEVAALEEALRSMQGKDY